MPRFEKPEHIKKEKEAIEKYIKYHQSYDFKYFKLGDWDIDFALTKGNDIVAYVEIKGRNKNIADAFPLPVALRKVAKLQERNETSIIIWNCYDGIIFGLVKQIQGNLRWGGRDPRYQSTNDEEMMIYYDDQKNLTKIKNEQNGTP